VVAIAPDARINVVAPLVTLDDPPALGTVQKPVAGPPLPTTTVKDSPAVTGIQFVYDNAPPPPPGLPRVASSSLAPVPPPPPPTVTTEILETPDGTVNVKVPAVP
jgi:hypothetical protein